MARTQLHDDHLQPLSPLWQCRQDLERVDRVLAALLCERQRLARIFQAIVDARGGTDRDGLGDADGARADGVR